MFRLKDKIASAVVAAYPFRRGRYRLRELAARRFLLGRTDFGCWVRVSGVSGFEWKILDGYYNEPRTIAAMKRLIYPGMTVFDLGANIGYYSLLAAHLVGPTGRVHSFEPTPIVFQRLAENVASNDLTSRIQVNCVAVGAVFGMIDFYECSDDSEGNSLFQSKHYQSSFQVPVDTLDRYMSKHNVRSIDLLKIDIEGAEPLALQGATELLARDDAPLLIIEFNVSALRQGGSSAAKLKQIVESFGYVCYQLEELSNRSDTVWNCLATKACHVLAIERSGLRLPLLESGVTRGER